MTASHKNVVFVSISLPAEVLLGSKMAMGQREAPEIAEERHISVQPRLG